MEERRLGKRREGVWGQKWGVRTAGRLQEREGGEVSLPALGNCLTSRLAAECQSPPLLSPRSPWGLHPLMAV